MSHELREGVKVQCWIMASDPYGNIYRDGVVRMQTGDMSMVPWIIAEDCGTMFNCAHLVKVQLDMKEKEDA